MLVAERVDAVEWEVLMFNVSAGTVLLRLKSVASFAHLTFPLTGLPLLDVTTKTLAMSAHPALILAIFKAPLAFLKKGLVLVTAGKGLAVPALPAILVVKMELALPIARVVKPVTQPMWTVIAVASR